jgi:hypothetical protein
LDELFRFLQELSKQVESSKKDDTRSASLAKKLESSIKKSTQEALELAPNAMSKVLVLMYAKENLAIHKKVLGEVELWIDDYINTIRLTTLE